MIFWQHIFHMPCDKSAIKQQLNTLTLIFQMVHPCINFDDPSYHYQFTIVEKLSNTKTYEQKN